MALSSVIAGNATLRRDSFILSVHVGRNAASAAGSTAPSLREGGPGDGERKPPNWQAEC